MRIARRAEGTVTDAEDQKTRVQKRKRERKRHADDEAIADVARQGEKESKEEN